MKYNPERYHRRSIRLKRYDYSKNGYYFIIICSNNRECIFCNLNVGAGLAFAHLALTNVGRIIEYHWLNIPIQYENVYIDEYIIMPNHMHGIMIIDKEGADARPAPTISDIICSFKSQCIINNLKRIKENNLNETGKIWQCNYFEHIIRNENELEKIRPYNVNNPYKWDEDNDNPENIDINNQSLQPTAYRDG